MSEQHCPACGEVMTAENSQVARHASKGGRRWLVCKDEAACFDRYYERRDQIRRWAQ